MAYRFWDMDHTICANDCDVSWKEFMIATGRAPARDQEMVTHYYKLYQQNALPFDEFTEFQLREFIGQPPAVMALLAQEHFDSVVKPRIFARASALIREQCSAGDLVCLLTATNEVIAQPLAADLGIPWTLATGLELEDGLYTGRIRGTYCCGPGKVKHLRVFCQQHGIDLVDAWYYGDSTSDQDVLGTVGHPVATNPMPELKAMAEERGWSILNFHE